MLASINVGSQFGEAYHDGSLIYLGFFSDLDGGARDALSADGVSFGRPVSSPPTPVPTETPAETPTAEGNGGEDAGEAAAITATPTPLPTIAPIRTGGGASSVTIAGAGTFDLDERALFHLHRTADGGYQLIVLAGNAQELAAAIELLLTGGMQDCLITAQTALCSISEIVQPSPTATLTPTETFTPPPFLSETPGDTPTPGTPPPNPIPPD
jgi:hypothetical protein